MKVTIESRGEARMMLTLLKTLEDQESPLLFDPATESMYEALADYNLTTRQREIMDALEEITPRCKLAIAALIGVDMEYAAFAYG